MRVRGRKQQMFKAYSQVKEFKVIRNFVFFSFKSLGNLLLNEVYFVYTSIHPTHVTGSLKLLTNTIYIMTSSAA